MVMIDFLYGDKKLSDFTGMIGYINASASTEIDMGSELVIDSFINNSTFKTKVQKVRYETPITATFDIVKNVCSGEDLSFTDKEVSAIMRWLNSKTYKKFVPIYDDSSFSNVYYNGTFNSIKSIVINNRIIGFTLVFTNDSPFGYINNEFNAELQAGESFYIFDNSDEIIEYCPKISILCLESGNLKITNSSDKNVTVIKNCTSNEELFLDAENKIITSSINHNKLYNDFNYNYPKVFNTEYNGENIYTVSLDCKITLTYQSYKKVGICV